MNQQELKELLRYDPTTGLFTWKVGRHRRVKVGDIAGSIQVTTGYMKVRINKKEYALHRLAWLYMEGYLPEYHLDHMNGVRDDNRWENLRHVTRSCNMQNQKVRTDNKSGYPGVSWSGSSWAVNITIDMKQKYIGCFDDVLEAALARYTVEVQCSKWTCNYRSKLVEAIQREWADFKTIQ